jgi:hypothetical protein
LPPKTDIRQRIEHVCFVPIADLQITTDNGASRYESQLLKILEPMMAAFKREIAAMRKAGASQADIDAMLDKFAKVYALEDDDEGKLVVAG